MLFSPIIPLFSSLYYSRVVVSLDVYAVFSFVIKTFQKNKTTLYSVSSLTSYSLSSSLRYLRCYDRSISSLPITFAIRLWAQIRNRKLGEARWVPFPETPVTLRNLTGQISPSGSMASFSCSNSTACWISWRVRNQYHQKRKMVKESSLETKGCDGPERHLFHDR